MSLNENENQCLTKFKDVLKCLVFIHNRRVEKKMKTLIKRKRKCVFHFLNDTH